MISEMDLPVRSRSFARPFSRSGEEGKERINLGFEFFSIVYSKQLGVLDGALDGIVQKFQRQRFWAVTTDRSEAVKGCCEVGFEGYGELHIVSLLF